MLFDRTSYMSEICTDLIQMVEILDDFYKFLGPELKSVTGDTEGIDAVISRVQEMVKPVECLHFPVFDRDHAQEWSEVKAKFYENNEKIKVCLPQDHYSMFLWLQQQPPHFPCIPVWFY